MALPTIVLNNETGSDITLAQLNVVVPGSGSIDVSGANSTDEILNDTELQDRLGAGDISVTYNGVDLTVAQSQSKILPQQALDILHNLNAVTDPSVSDDEDAGYSSGSLWINTTTRNEFRLIDPSPGSASWLELSASNNKIVLIRESNGNRSSFATITGALAAASSGDVVEVGPGTYAESFTVPSGVTLQGISEGADAIISGSADTGTRVTLSDQSVFDGFFVNLPTDATPAITFSGAGATQAFVKSCALFGNGASGIGISNTGSGMLTVFETRYVGGSCNQAILVSSGSAEISDFTVTGGTVSRGVEVSGSSSAIILEYLVDPSVTMTRGCHFQDSCNVQGSALLLDSPVTAVYIANSGPTVSLISSVLRGSTFDLEVDSGASTGTLNFVACELSSDRVSIPAGYLSTANVTISFQDTKEGDEGFRIVGELSTGVPERGSEASFGEGDSYSRGMVVLNYTGATAGSDGSFNADVSAAAASPSGSTFGFPSGAVGDTIVWGSSLEDTSDTLKHWGLKLLQTTAMSTDGVVIWEIWDGSAWAEIGVLDVENSELYRYANLVFIRANSDEQIRYGIDRSTTWVSKSLNGNDLFWSRVRIITAPTTSPVFQQSKLHASRLETNPDGTLEFFGTARFSDTLAISGNVFGEAGGVTTANVPVGSGGAPTGWIQQLKNSLMNGNGDAVTIQYILPRGIDTSFPLTVVFTYASSVTATNVTLIGSLIPLEVSGVLVADPTGGITPVPRAEADTETLTAKPGQADTQIGVESAPNKVHRVEFGPFDISDYYEGDLICIRLELDNDGAPGNTDIAIFNIEVNGVKWTMGERL